MTHSDTLAIGASDHEALAFMEATLSKASANSALAHANGGNIWPWHRRRWRQLQRQINHEDALIRQRLYQSQAWRRDHADRNGVSFVPVQIP